MSSAKLAMAGLTGAFGSPLLTVELFAKGQDDSREGVEIVRSLVRNELGLLTGACGAAPPMPEGPYLAGLRTAVALADIADDVSSYLTAMRGVLGTEWEHDQV